MSRSPVTDVVMFTNAVAPDKLGGLERYVRELSAQLVSAGLAVTVVTKRVDSGHPHEETASDGVHIVRHAVPSKKNPLFAAQYPLSVARGVRAELRRHPSAVLHGHYAFTTVPLAFGSSTPYAYTFHAPVHKEVLAERQDSYALPGVLQRSAVAAVRSAERRVVSHARQAIVLSDFMRGQLAELSAEAAGGALTLPGGIDTEWFVEARPTRDDWAADADPLLFTARRFTQRTGVGELVAAMADVVRRHPRAKLAVAGDGRLRPEIERVIGEAGLEQSVRLLGRVSDEELRRWYQMASLTLMPTQELEGFGLTTGESLACGTPVLVTPVGANPELVAGLHPLLVATGTTSADLATSVCRLLDAPAVLAEVRERARDHAVSLWSWKVVADRHLEMYSGLRDRSC